MERQGILSQTLHIGLVTETYPPEVNGVSLTLQSLAGNLSLLGHRVTVVRPWRDDLPQDDDAVEVMAVPGAPLPRYPGLRFGLPVTGRLKSFCRQQRPDVLYLATEGPLGWAAMKAARQFGIPALSGYHTRFDQYLAHYRLGLARPWASRYLRRFHNRTSATLVPTRSLRDELQAEGYRHVSVLPRGLDTHLFNPQKRDAALRCRWGVQGDAPVVLSVGRIAGEKNLDLAVDAFAAFLEERPDARYVWVGDGPAREALQRRHPEYIFAGIKRGEELARHYASADVFLFPSQTDTFGNVTLEALASGLALVAYDYGAAGEYVRPERDGYLAPLGDDEQFLRWVRYLGQHPEALARVRGKAPQAVAQLRAEQVAMDFVAIIHEHQRKAAA